MKLSRAAEGAALSFLINLYHNWCSSPAAHVDVSAHSASTNVSGTEAASRVTPNVRAVQELLQVLLILKRLLHDEDAPEDREHPADDQGREQELEEAHEEEGLGPLLVEAADDHGAAT